MSRRRQSKFRNSKRTKIAPYKRKMVWGKSGGVCWYCGTRTTRENFTVDHVIPCSKIRAIYPSERNYFKNLVPCCAPCNSLKSDMTVEEFRNLRSEQRGHRERIVFWFENNQNYTPNQCFQEPDIVSDK